MSLSGELDELPLQETSNVKDIQLKAKNGKGLGGIVTVKETTPWVRMSDMVQRSTGLVGYSVYLDLLGPLTQGKERHDQATNEELDALLEAKPNGRQRMSHRRRREVVTRVGPPVYPPSSPARSSGRGAETIPGDEYARKPGRHITIGVELATLEADAGGARPPEDCVIHASARQSIELRHRAV